MSAWTEWDIIASDIIALRVIVICPGVILLEWRTYVTSDEGLALGQAVLTAGEINCSSSTSGSKLSCV